MDAETKKIRKSAQMAVQLSIDEWKWVMGLPTKPEELEKFGRFQLRKAAERIGLIETLGGTREASKKLRDFMSLSTQDQTKVVAKELKKWRKAHEHDQD